MPIYDYKCDKCGKHQERIVKNKQEIVKCDDCGNIMNTPSNKIYKTSFQLKGNFH